MHDERSSDMKMMILAAMLAVCGFIAAAADVRGVYKLAGERRLILVERGQAVIRDGARFSQYGSWSVERVEGMERVVMRLWDKDQWQLEMKPRVWLFDILPEVSAVFLIVTTPFSTNTAPPEIAELLSKVTP